LFGTGNHVLPPQKKNIKIITSHLYLPFVVEIEHFFHTDETVCVDSQGTDGGFGHNYFKRGQFVWNWALYPRP
jgi:hypothetical protein